MKSWARPLWIFLIGNLALLVIFLFMPAVDSAVNSTAAATANVTSTFWGWGWLMSAGTVRWLLYAFCELVVIFAAGYSLYKSKT